MSLLLLSVFKSYYPKLVKLLPMNNVCFMSELYGNDLLPGELKTKIELLPTSVERASKFLDNVIKPSVEVNDSRKFHILLELMKEIDDFNVRELAEKINIKLERTMKCMALCDNETGKYWR